MGFFFGEDDIPFFIPGKFIEKIFLCEFPAIFLFGSQFRRNWEYWHQRIGIEFIFFYFISYFLCIFDGFG